jgi:hypothetical protein
MTSRFAAQAFFTEEHALKLADGARKIPFIGAG